MQNAKIKKRITAVIAKAAGVLRRGASVLAAAEVGSYVCDAADLLRALVSLTWEMPVPGMDTVLRVRPFAILVMRYPLVPTLYPMPDLLRLTRTYLPSLIDLRKRVPIEITFFL